MPFITNLFSPVILFLTAICRCFNCLCNSDTNKISFDTIELITRKKKKKIHISKLNFLSKILKKKVKLDIKNITKEVPYLKGQENRLPKIDVNIPKAGQTFKSEDLFVDMSNVNPAFRVGLVEDINPNAKFFKDLTKEQKAAFVISLLSNSRSLFVGKENEINFELAHSF